MSKPRCSQCGLTSTIDCLEEGCPGVAGFHPSTWARPLIQMAADLERYEALLMKLSDHMDTMLLADEGGHIARLICDEASTIRKKKGGRAMTIAERCTEIRAMAGIIRAHLSEMRGAVPADELLEAQRHLLGLTNEVNQAEARQHTAPPPIDRKRAAANDIEPITEPS